MIVLHIILTILTGGRWLAVLFCYRLLKWIFTGK